APVVIVHQSSPLYRRPRTSNLHVFDNPGTPSNTPKGPSRGRTYESSRNDQQRGDMGRSLRDLFRESGSSGSSQPSSTGGTTTTSGSRGSSSSGSSSSGSSSSGSKGTGGTAPVRRF
ncbi:MAG TPA: hypothetical protein VHK69_22065, partial [Chitinophagaceae bacterium]|nr:hypothetical protein [Chitinophagaceae bacterium]